MAIGFTALGVFPVEVIAEEATPPQRQQPKQPLMGARGQLDLATQGPLDRSPPRQAPRQGGATLPEGDPRWRVVNGRSYYRAMDGREYYLRPIPGLDPEVQLAIANRFPMASQWQERAAAEADYILKHRMDAKAQAQT